MKMSLKEIYQSAKMHANKILVGSLLLGGLSALSLDSILNTKKGSFIDPQTKKKYEYHLVDRGNSNHLYVWAEDSNPMFAEKIRDFDGDGRIDHNGGLTYPRMPFEINMLDARPDLREKSQRLYELALADSKKVEEDEIH